VKHYLLSFTKRRQYILLTGDILVLGVSIFISYFLRVYLTYRNPSLDVVLSRLSPWLLLVILAHVFSLYVLDQYNLNRLVNPLRSSFMVILSVWLAGLLISGSFFFLPKYVFGRQVLLIHLLVLSASLVLWRLLYTAISIRRAKPKRLAVVGNEQIASSFIEELSHIPNCGFRITDVCISKNRGASDGCLLPTSLTKHKKVLDLLKSNDFDVLAFDSTAGLFSDSEIRRILQVKYRGKAIYDLPTLYKNQTGKVPLTYIDGRWLLSSDGLQGEVNLPYVRVKRMFDMVLSGLLLVFSGPLFVMITAAIKLESKGRVFFIQERLGIQKKPFNCIKFRTMVENAESESGPMWSGEKDPRITRVGRLLRKSRLDELPQLWNILKGDISFVGPRPIREYFAKKLEGMIPFYGLRFSVKPGLSGWAQVNYDYAGSEEGQLEKFQYELFYIQNMSFFLDLLTMLKTLKIVFLGKGK
jgi:exopolysaccharide biosynthesis polyprenyl glycosylphosphotransferase